MFSTRCQEALSQIECPFKRHAYCRRAQCPFRHRPAAITAAGQLPTAGRKADELPCKPIENGKCERSTVTNNDSGYLTGSPTPLHPKEDPENSSDLDVCYNDSDNGAAEGKETFEEKIAKLFDMYHPEIKCDSEAQKQPVEQISVENVQQNEIMAKETTKESSVASPVPKSHVIQIKHDLLKGIVDDDKGNEKAQNRPIETVPEMLPAEVLYGSKKRIANVPSKPAAGGKDLFSLSVKGNIKAPLRIKMIRKFQQEYKKLGSASSVKSGEIAEEDFFDESQNKQAYIHKCMKFICNLRSSAIDKPAQGLKTRQPDDLNGSLDVINTKTKRQKMDPAQPVPVINLEKGSYQNLLGLIASIDELADNGYPILDFETRTVSIQTTKYCPDLKTGQLIAEGNEICLRCKAPFSIIDSIDSLGPLDSCHYHPEKIMFSKDGHGQKFHKCCQQSKGADGCRMAKYHVHRPDPDFGLYSPVYDGDLFVSESQSAEETAVYALDCEMIYTTGGIELARLSVVDSFGEAQIDMIIRPAHDIIDCNTEYSGLKSEDLISSKFTFDDAKSALRELLNQHKCPPILVGHSLENDLIALRTYYFNVIDTSLVYAPPQGGYKFQLKKLAQTHLNKLVQESVNGHCSIQDSVIALELVAAKMNSLNKRAK